MIGTSFIPFPTHNKKDEESTLPKWFSSASIVVAPPTSFLPPAIFLRRWPGPDYAWIFERVQNVRGPATTAL